MDVATTGVDPDRDRIVAIALVGTNFVGDASGDYVGRPQVLHSRFGPVIATRAEATGMHGIGDKGVRGKQTFATLAEEVPNFIGNPPLVGHNVSFDQAFLSALLQLQLGPDGEDYWCRRPFRPPAT